MNKYFRASLRTLVIATVATLVVAASYGVARADDRNARCHSFIRIKGFANLASK